MIDFEGERLRKAAPKLLEALRDLLGDRGDVQDSGLCVWCGRDYEGDVPEDFRCTAEDCPGHIARAVIAGAGVDAARNPCYEEAQRKETAVSAASEEQEAS